MGLLSINSHVVCGHVGHAATVFALQRLGVEVWPIHTVELSNHPGHGAFRGRVTEAAAIRDLVEGLAGHGALARCRGVITGYLGTAENGAEARAAVALIKAADPAARYCCDPVIGDTDKGIYVRPETAEVIRDRLVPAADVVTPNAFELEFLGGRRCATTLDVLAAIDALHARGPRIVLATSVATDETPADTVDTVVSEAAGRFRLRTPKLALSAHGAGDLLAALFFAHWLDGGDARLALARAGSSLYGIVSRTVRARSPELLLIEAQDELVAPSELFEPEPI
jgi:pyridoxine kinase